MSVEDKLNQILANQAAAAQREAIILTTLQGLPNANTDSINTALQQIEAQVTTINATLGTDDAAAVATGAAPIPGASTSGNTDTSAAAGTTAGASS